MDVLSIQDIGNGVKNPRGDVGDVTDLVKSILANGLINPITVRRNGDGSFDRICGARRLAAIEYILENHKDHHRAADFEDGVPVNAVEVSEMEAMAMAYEENTNQAGHKLTMGQKIRYVVEIYRVENDQKKTGELTGLSQPSVSQYLKIVESGLADLSLALLDEGKVTQKLVIKVIDNVNDNDFGKDLLEAVADGRVKSSVAIRVCDIFSEKGADDARSALEDIIAGDNKTVKSTRPTAKERSAMFSAIENAIDAPDGALPKMDLKAFMAGMRYVLGQTPKFVDVQDGAEMIDLQMVVEYVHAELTDNVVELPSAPTTGVKKAPPRKKAPTRKAPAKKAATKKTSAKKSTSAPKKGKRLAVGAK